MPPGPRGKRLAPFRLTAECGPSACLDRLLAEAADLPALDLRQVFELYPFG